MGYRSDVALALTKQGVADLKNALTQPDITQETRKEVESLLANSDTHLNDPDTGAEMWYWGDLKWYADYPDVAFIENFTGSMVTADDYRFIRIGEDYDDVEVYGYFLDDPFDLYITRGIAFNSDK